MKRSCRPGRLADQLFERRQCVRFGEIGFAQIDLVAILERAQQLDAFDRAKLWLCRILHISEIPTRNSPQNLLNGAGLARLPWPTSNGTRPTRSFCADFA